MVEDKKLNFKNDNFGYELRNSIEESIGIEPGDNLHQLVTHLLFGYGINWRRNTDEYKSEDEKIVLSFEKVVGSIFFGRALKKVD